MPKPGRKSMSQVLADLSSAPFPALDDLKALSDLTEKQTTDFKLGWPDIPAERRAEIMKQLGEMAEDAFDLNINAVSRVALNDDDPDVRAIAIHNLWEDEGQDLVQPFLNFLTRDDSEAVRTAAATALGIYVYMGEMEELPAEIIDQIEAALLKTFNSNEPLDVRRRSLESLGFSQRTEAIDAIDRAYEDEEDLMRQSALFAMGRNLDTDRWGDIILSNFTHSSSAVRFEAARASGEMQYTDAIPALGELLHDADQEVAEMSAWALGEIGGPEARQLLDERLKTTDDEDLTAAIEDAIANADLMGDMLDFENLSFDDDDDDDGEDELARKARLN
jgi:HEAT repeat protein